MVSPTCLSPITLYRLMCSTVLVNNLHINIKPIYGLYSILKDWEKPPTVLKITFASGKKKFDGVTEGEYLKKVISASDNIKKAFEDQQAQAGICKPLSSFIYWTDKVPDKDHGIRTDLKNSWPNGLLHVTSCLTRLKNQNSLCWWIIHITLGLYWRF